VASIEAAGDEAATNLTGGGSQAGDLNSSRHKLGFCEDWIRLAEYRRPILTASALAAFEDVRLSTTVLVDESPKSELK